MATIVTESALSPMTTGYCSTSVLYTHIVTRRVDRSIVYHMAVDVLIIILQYLYGA